MTATHPTDLDLADFLLGKLPDPDSAGVESHLSECDPCRDRAATVRADDTFTELLTAARTRFDARRMSAPTPTLDGAATPPAFAPTLAWEAPGADATGPATEAPAVLIAHPKYRPVRRLGTGGMGTVWLAEHRVMNRPVAIKVIRPDLLARPGATGRFLREVRAAAKLHHPNIVTAFDAEPAGDSCLLVMEYVPGKTLGEHLDAGPLPVAEACRAVRDAARGLAHAHAAGLVHRDVKPHNLIRAADGTTKVLDFGLAGVGAGEAVAADGERMTGAGMVVGTPDYIAPEQITNPHAADARADIYGLGCTLYHLLAGRPPLPDGSVAEKLAAQPTHTPDPIPGLPAALAAVLAKMTAKDPKDRYQSADEVVAALERCIRMVDPARRRRRCFAAVAAGLLAAGLLIAAGVVIKIERDNQIITVTTDDPDIEVVMKRKGEVLRIRDTVTGKEWELNTVANDIGLADQPDGLRVSLPEREPFVLKRNGKAVFTVARVARPVAAGDATGLVRLRTFTPERDPAPVPLRGPATAVTVVGDSWRIENRAAGGNFNVLVARVADGLPKDGVLVFRAKVKVEATDVRAWGDLGFGGANVVFPSWDQWPAALARYDGSVAEWAEKEVRYPAAALVKTDPPTVHLYAGLHADGVLFLKDVELLHQPAAETAGAPEAKLDAAVRAAEAWLKLVDAGEYVRAWEQADIQDRKAIPEERYVQLFQELALKNGKLRSRTLTGREFEPMAGGARSSRAVLLTYQESFERSGDRSLTVGVVLEADGHWRVQTWRFGKPSDGPVIPPPAPRLVQTIADGLRFPQRIEYTPDGKAILAAGRAYFAAYDPATGKSLFIDNLGFATMNTPLTVSADSRTAAVASGDLFVYDLAARKRVTTIPRREVDGKHVTVTALTLSPDGQKLAYVAGREVVYHDRSTGQTEHTRPDDDTVRPITLRYSPDGRYLAVASRVEPDQTTRISILDAKTRELLVRPQSNGLSELLQFSPDGRQLFISGTANGQRTFAALGVAGATGTEVEPVLPAGRVAPVPSPDGRLLALVKNDGTVQIWDRARKQVTFAWTPHPNARPEFPQRDPKAPQLIWTTVAFAPDGRTLATAHGDQIKVWDLTPIKGSDGTNRGGLVHHLPWSDGDANAVWPAFSPDGRYVLASTAGDRPTTTVWEAESGKRVAVVPAGGHATFLPDSRHVLATGPDSRLVLWDVVADREVRKFEKHPASANTLSVAADGTRAVSGDPAKTFVLWDVATGRPLAEFAAMHEERFAVSISPDGKRIATVGLQDRQAMLWEVEHKRVIWAWKGTRSLYGPIAWLPDGRNFVTTVDADGTVVRFDERTAEPQLLFNHPPTKLVWNLSPDGRLALVHDDPASVRVVDLRGRGDLGRVTLPAPASGWVAVSPDGRLGVAMAAPAVAGGRVYVFRVPQPPPTEADIQKLVDPANAKGDGLPYALLERNGVAVMRFGKWRLVFDGVPCDSGGKVLFGVSRLFFPEAAGRAALGVPRIERPAPPVGQQWNGRENMVFVNDYRFLMEAKGTRLVFGDQAYEAKEEVQTIVIARDGTTRLEAGPKK